MRINRLLTNVGLFAFLITIFNVGSGIDAQAKLQVCNETGKVRDVAIGYKGDEDWTSEGWWTVEDGDCRVLIKEDLKRLFYYYRAQFKGGDFDGERYIFCTQKEPFTIVGDKDCKSRGFNTADFRKLELIKGVTGFTLTLDESNIYSAETLAAKDGDGNDESKSAPSTQSDPTPDPEPAPATEVTTGPDAPVGTHGEPYSLQTKFDGCDYVDGLLWCTFKYEDWTYTVKDDGKSHEYILNEIDALPIGATVDISGDMISYSGNGADITVRSYEQVSAGGSTDRSNGRSTGAAPGIFGEPYTITGIFKGCSDEFGEQACIFNADDWRYVVPNDGKTDSAVWNAMQGLTVNHRYEIEGDIAEYGDISAIVTVRNFESVYTSDDEITLNSLVGLWTSTQDPTYQMRVTNDHRRLDYSSGELAWEAELSIKYQCDDLQIPATDEKLLQANGPDGPEDVLCYGILEQSDYALELMYLPRGNILAFEKRDGDS